MSSLLEYSETFEPQGTAVSFIISLPLYYFVLKKHYNQFCGKQMNICQKFKVSGWLEFEENIWKISLSTAYP